MKQVILVLSERAAELLMWQVDYHLEGRDTDELEILAAVGTEIDAQLSSGEGPSERPTVGIGFTDAARIADRMAKAARAATEPEGGAT